MSLRELATLGDLAQTVYDSVLPYAGLWDWVRLRLRLPNEARLPSLETPTAGDGLTVRRHLDLARDKAQRPARLAMVGVFSVGKSTLLNTILHTQAFNQMLHAQLGIPPGEPMLKVGPQATTGNITELEFVDTASVGEDEAAPRGEEVFQFGVRYLSEVELRDLFAYLVKQLDLNVRAGLFDGPGWIERLSELLPVAQIRYDTLPPSNEYDRKSLICLAETIQTLQNAECRKLLANGSTASDHLLGTGREGLARFKELLARPTINHQSAWKDIKPYVHPFHLVKFVRVRLPHPDFGGAGLRFSLLDFPGLGSGMPRDDFISREFISEANVILSVYQPKVVGGESVMHIMRTFTTKRAGLMQRLGLEGLLNRVFFICNGSPDDPPRDAHLPILYRDFFQAVRHLLGGLLNNEPAADRRKALLRQYLSHFLACDAKRAGTIRGGVTGDSLDTAVSELKNRRDKGYYSWPTEPEVLRAVADNEEVRSDTDGYPMLADLLREDAAVGRLIAKSIADLAEDAGGAELVRQLRSFVQEKAPDIRAEDVREHLRSACAPLADLVGLVLDRPADGMRSLPAQELKPLFDQALEFEEKWQRVLKTWVEGDQNALGSDREELEKHVKALTDLQVSLHDRVKERVEKLVSQAAFTRFRLPLTRPDDGFERWVARKSRGRRRRGEDDEDDDVGLLNLDHTLLLYRFYLSCRNELMRSLYTDLLPGYVQRVVQTYREAGGDAHWNELSVTWQKLCRLIAQPRDDYDRGVAGFRTDKKTRFLDTFFTAGAQHVASAEWPARQALTELLPPDGADTCAGAFFEEELVADAELPVRLGSWVPAEKLPSNARQLSVCLVRMRLLHARDEERKARQAPELPECGRDRILQVLRAVGVLDGSVTENDLAWAEEGADYWPLPLPQLTGKLVRDKKLLWNPFPLDLYKGGFERPWEIADTSRQPEWVGTLRQFLTELFTDLADRCARIWRKSDYQERWQNKLVKTLAQVSDHDHVLWRWLNEHGERLSGDDPLEARKRALLQTIAELRRHGLLVPSTHP